MTDTGRVYYKRNFFAFLWHALFLALAQNFTDTNTIIPSMILNAGGTTVHIGIQTAIMIGGSNFMQILFAGFLSRKEKKKGYLILGISLRISALFSLSVLLYKSNAIEKGLIIWLIFIIISVFSFSGAFANISYVDILGKSIKKSRRKQFFTLRQTIISSGILISALIVRKLVRLHPYPFNYSLLFSIASALLLTASIGFWIIRERPTDLSNSSLWKRSIVSAYVHIFKSDKNIRMYLLLINCAGLGLTLVPFYVGLAKQNLGLDSKIIGNFLLVQIVGMIISNYVWHRLLKSSSYKGVVRIYAILGSIIPILALFLSGELGPSSYKRLYPLVFFLAGFNFSAYQIFISGILLEISHEYNRALYTALSGAGSITTIVFPLIGGLLISLLGYTIVFLFDIVFIGLSIIIVNKLVCPPPSFENY